jgi:hypothetical protein
VAAWREQNTQDSQRDMQQLEGLVLQAVGGMEALQQQLASQEGVLQGQAVGLQQVAAWLADMRASSGVITGHLQRLHGQMDGLREGVDGIGSRLDCGVEDISSKLDQVLRLMHTNSRGSGGGASSQQAAKGPVPSLLIPRSSLVIPDGALARGASGAFGTVLRALRDGSAVAVKVFNYRVIGELDQEDAVREALLLQHANHHNVVRCFGIVHDPGSDRQGSIHGSLVMEWVGGGTLYEWLQANPRTGLPARVRVALQVAAGMRHLHQQRMVHGDLKPQNILLQFMRDSELPEVSPQQSDQITAAVILSRLSAGTCG